MSKAFYNEIDPRAAATLRELIKQGAIAPGVVDERSIEDITPEELAGYDQCHFFAGFGVWSYALRLAGWPDDKPVWTGSCPCQPFSAAGKGTGFTDERHLWPAFQWLIGQCKPDVVFGEQVASKDGLAWLDVVQTDMEGEGYAFGALDLCSAGVGAPHIRQRLHFGAERHPTSCRKARWVADNDGTGQLKFRIEEVRGNGHASFRNDTDGRGAHGGLGNTNFGGSGRDAGSVSEEERGLVRRFLDSFESTGSAVGLAGFGSLGDRKVGKHPAFGVGYGSQADGAGGLADTEDGDGRRGERGTETGAGPDSVGRRGPAGSGAAGGLAESDDAERRADCSHGNDCSGADAGWEEGAGDAEQCGGTCGLADADGGDSSAEREQRGGEFGFESKNGNAGVMGDAVDSRLEGYAGYGDFPKGRSFPFGPVAETGAVGGFWADAWVVYCRDERLRPVEPGSFPLADGSPERVGRLRGYGNAINAHLAKEFIQAFEGR